jgi:membrane protein implicated in regulation of membrane protease activity
MIEKLVNTLGPWNWWILGIALLILEALVPGVFLFWIGLAAIVTGVLSLALWETSFWVWEMQAFVFAGLSLASALLGLRFMRHAKEESEEPLLNKRSESLVGRSAVLIEAISQGKGRIKLDDTTWIVNGPDLPEGTRVRIVSGSGATLTVEAAENGSSDA